MKKFSIFLALILISPYSKALTIVKDYPSNCELSEYVKGSSTRDFKYSIA